MFWQEGAGNAVSLSPKTAEVSYGMLGIMDRHADTIVDIGLYDGFDTQFYLSLGYKVIGVDADPMVIERCHQQMNAEVKQGRLTLLNTGISDQPQTLA